MSQLNGRYQILEQIGKGGFGVTFLAKDILRPGSPECVVKQFKPLLSDPKALQHAERLFNNEAIIQENLGKHDQIPRLLAYFEENQEFYLVQEYIKGHDLTTELVPGKKLHEADVIALLIDILEVLKFVHEQNVIHRDIKPSNIIRRQDGKIVLIDFGAVKQISTQIVNLQGQRTVTIAIGTPGYMPNEQTAGEPNFSSDIYALGIIGIQALTGLLPHQFPKDSETREIVWRNQTQVGSKLASVLDKMVCFDCRQRYQSAELVLQALQELSPKSSSKVLPPPPPQLWKWLIPSIAIAATITVITITQFSKNSSSPALEFSPYEDAELNIKIQYPTKPDVEAWVRQDLGNPVTGELVKFSSPKQSPTDNFQEQLTIKVENFSGTLEDAKNEFIQEIKSSTNSQDIISDIATLSHKQAYQLIYTVQDGEDKFKNLRIWTLKGDKAYIIIYTAAIDDYEKFLPTAKKMIASFQIN
ncbi:MAG: serine/threonine protein kinase [Goleter apudmare HA4340-LM2]|jgi:serine/threonine-protein kinase|nr:serine/threonine protein kinase [Goleter apudmare HA4340-LM2]